MDLLHVQSTGCHNNFYPGRASDVNGVSRMVDFDVPLRAIFADISRMGEEKKKGQTQRDRDK